MDIARTLPELRAFCERVRARRGALSLVPTMGALHPGHLALLDAARAGGRGAVASVFVNPLQFGQNEDFRRYPRDEARDFAALEGVACDVVWAPEVETMYPHGTATTIDVAGPALRWEGEHRPGHFRGVATVVAKLFGQVRPDYAFFGEKDWQQVQVICRMVSDLHLPVAIETVSTVRQADGLAMSSRNRYLTPEQRGCAPVLYQALQSVATALRDGEQAAVALDRGRAMLKEAGFALDYFGLVDAATLEPLSQAAPGSRLLAAAWLGQVRLIDNIGVR
ncbi:MAG: pantoate--beta-alanine ligase [Acetobacteraceae bacterium]|nr:pantoate--beta-alanine ligase [Acetobacteraceae bacterium]MBV8524828.1 pantoate--beta-alanine ligase [Acetobacteraceae bacterium]